MGVRNLWDVLESCKKTHPLHHLRNKRVCVDLSCWVVQLQNVNKGYYAMKEKLYLRGLFHRIRALIALNCSLIFVTDGSIPAIKLATYRQRLNSGSEVSQDETESQKPQALRRNMCSEFSRMIKEAKGLGLAMGIPCLDGIEEAEAQCALLNSESLCDGCFTSDSDAFLFGARTVYRDICLGEGGHVIYYEMADIESKLGYGRNSLITLALLLGSDYSPGVHGLGPESACKIVKSVGDDKILHLIESEGLSFIEEKGTKRQTKDLNCRKFPSSLDTGVSNDGHSDNVDMKHQLLEVIEAYLKPKCHSADSGAVYQVLSQHPFQHAKLHQICMNFFEWPPEKTDEYILPKVAERDLRRYANLCLASSEAGLVLPISEMPVRCPVSEVVKPRKIQGIDSFEVLWEGVDGLETSVVPADLIQCACPEKIAEFEERKAAKKKGKRKPRSKKSGKVSALAEINSDLQTLMLDIESGSRNASIAWPSRMAILADCSNAAAVNSESKSSGSNHTSAAWSSRTATLTESSDAAAVDSESKNSVSNNTSAEWSSRIATLTYLSDAAAINSGNKSTVEAETEYINNADIAMPRFDPWRNLARNEFIDLLSPSPPPRPRKVSKYQQGSHQDVSAIVELSDSDNENLSPGHARKAQELRLFIASIKDDM